MLAFIGAKLIIEAMHADSLPFINSGQPTHRVPKIPTWLSLVVILSILAVTPVASLPQSRAADWVRHSGILHSTGFSRLPCRPGSDG